MVQSDLVDLGCGILPGAMSGSCTGAISSWAAEAYTDEHSVWRFVHAHKQEKCWQ